MSYCCTRTLVWMALTCTAVFSPCLSATGVLRYNLGTSGSSIPYENAVDEDRPGIFVELLPLIMDKAGLNTEKVMLSTKRAELAFKNGELDFDFFSPGWLSAAQSRDTFVFSVPIAPIKEYLIALPEYIDRYQRLENAYGGPVGTISGYVYFDDSRFSRVDFTSEDNLILALQKKRVVVAIMEEATARYWSARHKVEIRLGAIHTQGDIALRLHKRHASLVSKINSAITSLKRDGQINRVIMKYADMVGVTK